MADDGSLRMRMSHVVACHSRWMERRNRRMESPDYLDEWVEDQCGCCKYWIPLEGVFATDYGACTNEASAFDGVVRFEHDGCDAFVDAGEWITPISMG